MWEKRSRFKAQVVTQEGRPAVVLPQGVLGEWEAAGVIGEEPSGWGRGSPRPDVDRLTESFN